MRLKILRNLAKPHPDYREGDIREVSDQAIADDLIKRSLAVETDEDITPLDSKTGQRKVAAPAAAPAAGVIPPLGPTVSTVSGPEAVSHPKGAKHSER